MSSSENEIREPSYKPIRRCQAIDRPVPVGKRVTFAWVEQFIKIRFHDPEPEIPCVCAYRAVASVLLSAAVLQSIEPSKLQQFTGYHPAFIASIAWNMRNSKLWTAAAYNTSRWLSASGEMNDLLFLEDVEVAWGTGWGSDAEHPRDAIDTYQVYEDLRSMEISEKLGKPFCLRQRRQYICGR